MLELTYCPDSECGAPADVVDVYTLPSTDGPVEHATVVCVRRHRYTTVQ